MKKLVFLALLFASQARAEFYTGNEMLDLCRGNTGAQSICLGYFAGVYDALHGVTHCAPAGVTVGQAKDMVVRAMESVPEVRNETADRIAAHVFKKAWPCQRQNPTGARTL